VPALRSLLANRSLGEGWGEELPALRSFSEEVSTLEKIGSLANFAFFC